MKRFTLIFTLLAILGAAAETLADDGRISSGIYQFNVVITDASCSGLKSTVAVAPKVFITEAESIILRNYSVTAYNIGKATIENGEQVEGIYGFSNKTRKVEITSEDCLTIQKTLEGFKMRTPIRSRDRVEATLTFEYIQDSFKVNKVEKIQVISAGMLL